MTQDIKNKNYFHVKILNFKKINLILMILMMLILMITWSWIDLYFQNKKLNIKLSQDQVEFHNKLLHNQEVEAKFDKSVIENKKIFDNFQREAELKISAFAYQAQLCIDIKKKLNL